MTKPKDLIKPDDLITLQDMLYAFGIDCFSYKDGALALTRNHTLVRKGQRVTLSHDWRVPMHASRLAKLVRLGVIEKLPLRIGGRWRQPNTYRLSAETLKVELPKGCTALPSAVAFDTMRAGYFRMWDAIAAGDTEVARG